MRIGHLLLSLPRRRHRLLQDRLPLFLWGAALSLISGALVFDPAGYIPAALATAEPFAVVALIIVAATVADRLGVFRALSRIMIPTQAPPQVTFAALLTLTAVLSGLVNLDVAVVVAMPIALRTAQRSRLATAWLGVAIALTANATSFLLPNANLTTLLVLSRAALPSWEYVREAWLAWLLVSAVTITGLSLALGRRGPNRVAVPSSRPLSFAALVDLLPIFLAVSGIRTIVGSGLALPSGFVQQLAIAAGLAASLNNLPAAVALHVAGRPETWAAVLALSMGPNAFVTGSVASLICRRLARAGGLPFAATTFTIVGLAMLPLQASAAMVGLRCTGVLH